MMQNIKINSHRHLFLIGCLALLLLNSCNPTVYLKEDQALLNTNKIKLKDKKNVESPALLKEELALNYIQRPNKEFLFIPREWYYFRFEADPQPSKTKFMRVLKSFLKKNASEEPSIHSNNGMEQTAKKMQNYLQFKKGYYNASVIPSVKIEDKEAYVTYEVTTGKQYVVNELIFNCEDPRLVPYVDSIKNHTLIPKGTPVTETIFNSEKSRIVRGLQDEGFARFNSNHVRLQGDTANLKMTVYVNILRPSQDSSHQRYTVGQIKVYTDHSAGSNQEISESERLGDIDYYSEDEIFFVTPKTLSKRIYIEEGSIYRRNKELRTSQSLSNLNTYRFVSLNPTIDESSDSIINYNFLLSPVANKWVWEPSGGLYFSNLQRDSANVTGRYFLGVQLTNSLSSRNLFHSAVNYSLNLDMFTEFNLTAVNSAGLTLESRWRYPRLYDLTGLFGLINRVRILPESTFISLSDNTTSDIALSYSYNFTATVYSLTALNSTFGFNYQPNIYTAVRFNQIGISYLNLNPLEVFKETLEENPYLANSFNDRLLTGVVFQDLGYNYNSKVSRSGFNFGMFYYFETSGIELSILNSVFNRISGNAGIWELPTSKGNSIEFAKFFKIDLDHRMNQKIFGQHNLAARLRMGLAYTFGGSTSVPYVRQFSAGGQQSIRGWQIRALGPGGYDYSKEESYDPEKLPFQTGDFLLEGSLEYRFPLRGFVKGALFVDAGNVWVLSDQDGRENSQLSTDFYKQIAIASGFGIRLDFNYFLLRFDLGYKIRNPFPNENGSYLNYQDFKLSNIRDANLSFGINLPF